MRIFQLTPTIVPGDGVSQSVFFVAELLSRLGLVNQVLSQSIHPDLRERVASPFAVAATPQDILLYHHSVGIDSPLEAWVTGFPGRRFMVYHNITPAIFFPVGSAHHQVCTVGREQLRKWTVMFDAVLADSVYNRHELDSLGYQNTRTIPLLFDLEQLKERANQLAVPRRNGAFNVLFVGRIAMNKCQHQLIELMPYLQNRTNVPLHLNLVGGFSDSDYQNYLRWCISSHKLDSQVSLLGKVDDQQLHQCYSQADLFLSLSEHEGFGIPLIEAMIYDLPVAAYPAGAIAGTLGGAGKLLPVKHLPTLADAVVDLIHDPWQRYSLVLQQRQRLLALQPDKLLADFSHWLRQCGILPAEQVSFLSAPAADSAGQSHWQIQGPYDSTYSLALVNRELACALQALGEDVSLCSTEGPGDYPADQRWIERHAPDCLLLQGDCRRGRPGKLAVRNLYPPRLTDTNADLVILGPYGWEESAFPFDYVLQINARAHMVAAMSRYVADTLASNGVSSPIIVTGLGADHILRQSAVPVDALQLLAEGPIFLHVSSGFPRKGLDLLIKAFSCAFTPLESAQLVIKTFDNPHNKVSDWLQQAGWESHAPVAGVQTWRRSNDDATRIDVIWQELSSAELRWLYENSTALVAPTRGEGFGLPQAEAMFCRLPVITSAQGGHADFCTSETAWLIPVMPCPAETHFQQIGSLWFEPDEKALVQLLQRFSRPDSRREATIQHAWECVSQQCTWQRTADRLLSAADKLRQRKPAQRPNLAVITTWNQRCGVASYSRFLSSRFPAGQWQVFAPSNVELTQADEPNVRRCWQTGQFTPLTELIRALDDQGASHVLIQYNFSFFSLRALAGLICHLHARNIKPTLVLHATDDVAPEHGAKSLREIRHELTFARVLVHSLADIQRLFDWGIPAQFFPQGVVSHFGKSPSTALDSLLDGWHRQKAPIIASYGFLLPHKGILELITAFEVLKENYPKLKLLLLNSEHPAPISRASVQACSERLSQSLYRSDICLHTEYTADDEALGLLRRASLVVLPYQNTQESSSAAVRFALAACRPVFVTPLEIFHDVRDQVIELPGTSVSDIARGIREQLEVPRQIALNRESWLRAHQWSELSERLWRSIVRPDFLDL